MTPIKSLKKILSDKITISGFVLGLFMLAAFFVVMYKFTPLQAEAIPLHYNVYFGIDLVGPGYAYLIPVGINLLILLINFILALWAIERERLAARLLAWFTVGLILITSLATIITRWTLL